jgi:hypothetical protein
VRNAAAASAAFELHATAAAAAADAVQLHAAS